MEKIFNHEIEEVTIKTKVGTDFTIKGDREFIDLLMDVTDKMWEFHRWERNEE